MCARIACVSVCVRACVSREKIRKKGKELSKEFLFIAPLASLPPPRAVSHSPLFDRIFILLSLSRVKIKWVGERNLGLGEKSDILFTERNIYTRAHM